MKNLHLHLHQNNRQENEKKKNIHKNIYEKRDCPLNILKRRKLSDKNDFLTICSKINLQKMSVNETMVEVSLRRVS